MNVRVLLVDDERAFVDVLAERLETRGFDVSVVGSGEEAVAKISEQKIDVVVLDVVMPGMGGIETLRRIKAESPMVEVLLLSGHATVETAIEGMKIGACDYLLKPTETTELVEKISAAYQKKADQEGRLLQAGIQDIIGRKGW
jgi:two-component system, OmpR family, response regulator CpxR